jgi:hypothetical protein
MVFLFVFMHEVLIDGKSFNLYYGVKKVYFVLHNLKSIESISLFEFLVKTMTTL